jgi:hypothetical protein
MASRVQQTRWLWLVIFIQLCCAKELSVSVMDSDAFEQRALAPGIFIIACMLAPDVCLILSLNS